jgi:hypothetical protein
MSEVLGRIVSEEECGFPRLKAPTIEDHSNKEKFAG